MGKTTASAVLAAIALGIAGCGGDDDEDGASTAPPARDDAATTATSKERERTRTDDDRGTEPVGGADVTLTEFEVSLAKRVFSREGVYTLRVVNDGKRPHALEAEG